MPTPAMFSKSLGGVIPRPSRGRGTIANPTLTAAAFLVKPRRDIFFTSLIASPRSFLALFAAKSQRSFLLTRGGRVTKNLFVSFRSQKQKCICTCLRFV